MPLFPNPGKNIFLALLLLACTLGLGYLPGQSDFTLILSFFLPFFLIYLFVYNQTEDKKTIGFFIATAIALRLSLLFGMPNLSDDVYRFIWDGRLLVNGFNPFDQLPSYYLDKNIPGIDSTLFAQLNSPDYFTIYPPIAQGVFGIACWLFPKSLLGAAIVIKVFLVACEIGTLVLIPRILEHFGLPQKSVLLYALNPLIIIEVCGNLHFEGAMVFFLLLALWFLLRKKEALSAIAIALSIASKLLPFIFLPLLIRRLGWRRSVQYFLVVGLTLILLFAPLVNGVFLQNFGESLDLYFRRFEFNASIYYLLRWFGYQFLGYNLIAKLGPALAMVVLIGVLMYAGKEREPTWRNLPLGMLFAICLYLFCTTTVHPWYTSLPLVLCLFTRFRFPVLWTGLIFLTYINYNYEVYHENLWMVGLEYISVGFLLWFELRRKRRLQSI